MRKLISGVAFVVMLAPLPGTSDAQQRRAATGPRHEFGVDIGAAYRKSENTDGGIVIGTPLDVRVGLVSTGTMMWEPRVFLEFDATGGSTDYIFTPGVNVLFSNSPGRHRRGMYFTGGAGLVLADLGGTSGTSVQLNGGIGWRRPSGTAAWRYELGFRWTSESDLVPSTIEIGGRVGISLWK